MPSRTSCSNSAGDALDSGILPDRLALLQECIYPFALIFAVEQIDEPFSLERKSRAARRTFAGFVNQTLARCNSARAERRYALRKLDGRTERLSTRNDFLN